jgi:peptidoglycan/LPS O-acetylase OafA/YrhL
MAPGGWDVFVGEFLEVPLGFYSVLPFLGILLIACGFISLGPFRHLDDSLAQHRWGPMDGLRGFLALGVFGHHLAVDIGWLQWSTWAPLHSYFYAFVGPGSVALFFMITAFLFWGRLVDTEGQLPWKRFYLGRVFRIGPLYVGVILLMILVALAKTHFQLREGLVRVIQECGTWLSLGISSSHPDVNGLGRTWHIIVGVTWSLQYEWYFYFSLPFLAVAAKPRRHVLFAVIGLALSALAWFVWSGNPLAYIGMFFAGILVASLVRLPMKGDWTHPAWAVAGLAALVAPVLCTPQAYQPASILCLAFFFFLVVQGNTMFGSLSCRAARRLGGISFSLYMVHGLLINAAFGTGATLRYALRSPAHYWIVALAMTPILIMVASLSYLYIEKPGMAWGLRLAQKWDPR